ncbi:hypothetical protein GOBAR_AA40480 [Gossypium barbadense]|uniref:Uncharacterized protein n=1 Tax=Gossypium barbadense TaxID=3634 RepID=A0A2P5VN13_GOSBA|nr:hypothetical protein GOBAR_AA40480 [Gossypium barbadense]
MTGGTMAAYGSIRNLMKLKGDFGFTAAITLPGGLNSEKGSEQGNPFLIDEAAFNKCIGLYSLFLPSPSSLGFWIFFYVSNLLDCAVVVMVIAFSTSCYVVLKPSHRLASVRHCYSKRMLKVKLLRTLQQVREMLRIRDQESNTALHEAARCGIVEVVKALLEFEDPDFPYSANKKQETPLYITAMAGDAELTS